MYKEEKELWVKFACAALTGIIADDGTIEPEDAAALAWDYADHMLDTFYNKFKDC